MTAGEEEGKSFHFTETLFSIPDAARTALSNTYDMIRPVMAALLKGCFRWSFLSGTSSFSYLMYVSDNPAAHDESSQANLIITTVPFSPTYSMYLTFVRQLYTVFEGRDFLRCTPALVHLMVEVHSLNSRVNLVVG